MSKHDGGRTLIPELLAELQDAGQDAVGTQRELLRRLAGASAGPDVGLSTELEDLSRTATFKTRVQRSGRISIPDAEREALDIREGDIVQTVIVPVKRNRGDTNE
jgi:hypothetical protein